MAPAAPAMLAHLGQRLARYKCPVALAALPRNGAGKTLKAEPRALAVATAGETA